MGEAKRRKMILGDSYGNSLARRVVTYNNNANEKSNTYRLDLGSFTSTKEQGIAQIAAQAKREGVINSGVAVPFVININSGGGLMGLGFPSVNLKSNVIGVIVGMVVLKIVDIGEKEATLFYRSIENEVRYEIALAFKALVESDPLLASIK